MTAPEVLARTGSDASSMAASAAYTKAPSWFTQGEGDDEQIAHVNIYKATAIAGLAVERRFEIYPRYFLTFHGRFRRPRLVHACSVLGAGESTGTLPSHSNPASMPFARSVPPKGASCSTQ